MLCKRKLLPAQSSFKLRSLARLRTECNLLDKNGDSVADRGLRRSSATSWLVYVALRRAETMGRRDPESPRNRHPNWYSRIVYEANGMALPHATIKASVTWSCHCHYFPFNLRIRYSRTYIGGNIAERLFSCLKFTPFRVAL